MLRLTVLCLTILTFINLFSQTHVIEEVDKRGIVSDSTEISAHDSLQTEKTGFLKKFLAYFNDANKEKSDKKFDFSIIGGPHYSTDTKLGIGLVAAGLYRTDRADSLLPPSNISLYGDVSTVGFYLLGVRGTHLFPKDRYRFNYNLYFFFFSEPLLGNGV